MRKLIDMTISILSKIKKNQKIRSVEDKDDGLVKINLGCGLRVAKGWLNIDASLNALIASWPSLFHRFAYSFSGSSNYISSKQYCEILKNNNFLYHDLSLSFPINKESVDFIYSSHFFEHIFPDDAQFLLRSCYEALKPKGIIRISVPDLEYAISLYHQGKKKEMLDNFFFVAGKGSYLARHKYMYDFDMIKKILDQLGFINVKRYKYQEGKCPDITELDIYPEISLYVEAEKI
jgi:predicted SAM-dependent methyltransferase